MPCKSRFDLSFIALILVAMAFMPVASATSMNADSTPADEAIGPIPVAACDVGIAIDHRSSGDDYAKDTNNLLPKCLNGTGGGMLADLLWVLRQTEISGGTTNAIATGILSGSSTGVVAIGPFCGGSGSCFASATPVSAVPEPGTSVLLGLGLIAIAGLFRGRCIGRDFSFNRCS
jgi:hypothetical protein